MRWRPPRLVVRPGEVGRLGGVTLVALAIGRTGSLRLARDDTAIAPA
ncbi:MAG: hypothetical protein V4540_05410 [Pseudomonadota bacterium]